MKNTSTIGLAQACDMMHLFLKACSGVLLEHYNEMPEERRSEISRLGNAMWDEIAAAKEGDIDRSMPPATSFERARCDRDFRRFQARLLKRPRKNSKLAVSLANEMAH